MEKRESWLPYLCLAKLYSTRTRGQRDRMTVTSLNVYAQVSTLELDYARCEEKGRNGCKNEEARNTFGRSDEDSKETILCFDTAQCKSV